MKPLSRATDFSEENHLFVRVPSARNTRLTELRCSNCSSFLGASERQELLDFIQSVHVCRTVSGRPPRGADCIEPQQKPYR